MSIHDKLRSFYGHRLMLPCSIQDIPRNRFVVYVLVHNNNPIVVGHGKNNRAKVIFDNEQVITQHHFKALTVRLYWLFGETSDHFERYIIACESKGDAQKEEKALHKTIGGNSTAIPTHIKEKLFDGIAEDSSERMIINMALNSSFGGISDIRKWRQKGFLNDRVWEIVSLKLRIQHLDEKRH